MTETASRTRSLIAVLACVAACVGGLPAAAETHRIEFGPPFARSFGGEGRSSTTLSETIRTVRVYEHDLSAETGSFEEHVSVTTGLDGRFPVMHAGATATARFEDEVTLPAGASAVTFVATIHVEDVAGSVQARGLPGSPSGRACISAAATT